MIAVDSNLLIFAHRGESPFHEIAARRIEELWAGPEQWAIPWPCIHELFGIVTHERIFKPPTTQSRALAQIAEWMRSPYASTLSETHGYWDRLQSVIVESDVSGPIIHDAKIAAICLHHGVRELWTADRDFGRFPTLKTRNPLVGKA